MPIYNPSIEAPRRIWYQATGGTSAPSYVGDYAVIPTAGTGQTFITMRFGEEFTSISSCLFYCIPQNTFGTSNVDLFSAYCALGEDYSAVTESDTGTTYNFVAGELTAIDISPVLTGIRALDIAGIRIKAVDANGAFWGLGIELIFD